MCEMIEGETGKKLASCALGEALFEGWGEPGLKSCRLSHGKEIHDLKSRYFTKLRLQNAEESTTHEHQCRARLHARQTCPGSD